MSGKIQRRYARIARHARIRKKISGTAERPRFSIMISNKHMYVQVIDDQANRTIVSESTAGSGGLNNLAAAESLGQRIGEKAVGAGIRQAVVDRGGFRFHGRVRAIVEAAQGAGLQFGSQKAAPAKAAAEPAEQADISEDTVPGEQAAADIEEAS